ncbi:MAG: N-acetylneuraminate synthase family protein [Spirochaetes bacterium]|nr:N-acetylneuraminate synthase family protein [Spirochaetota bacterium]
MQSTHPFSLHRTIKDNGVFVIAEAGSNHDGSLAAAKRLVREAASAGAHAVKFQAFTKDGLFAAAAYTRLLKLPANALDGVKKIAFKKEWYPVLVQEARQAGILFMSTPFSPEAVDDMERAKVPCYKIASGDIQCVPLLKAVARTGKPVILSAGLASDDDIRAALRILKRNEVALLQCTVSYPAKTEDLHLRRIGTLAKRYSVIAGLSDHSTSAVTPAVAVACGARIIEKHFTVTPNAKGGDHAMSMSPASFAAMTGYIREAFVSLGLDEKRLTPQEKKELVFARRGIYAAADIPAGHRLREADIVALRPCIGISSAKWDSVIGKRLPHARMKGESLTKKDIR